MLNYQVRSNSWEKICWSSKNISDKVPAEGPAIHISSKMMSEIFTKAKSH